MKHDVVIVGLGPVGSTAALLLAEAGLKAAAVEKDTEAYKLPRAVNLDGEIIRGFQRIGRGKEVNSLMQPVRPGDRAGFANSKREWLFGQNFAKFGANGWQPGSMFDQPEFERHLRGEVLNHPNITSFVGREATDIRSTEEGVHLITSGPDGPEELQARYLIGCDGAGSFVRRSFNIGWRDLGCDCDWLVVDITLKEGHTLTNDTL